MYTLADPYCFPGTSILKSIPGLRKQRDLDRFETVATGCRFLEAMPAGRYSAWHYRAIHKHIFQDVYTWAGRPRTVRISRSCGTYCDPEHIVSELRRVFAELRRASLLRGLDAAGFAKGAAHFAADLNAIHVFRDGNGRSQLAFLALLAAQAGHTLILEQLDPDAFRAAMTGSFHGNEDPLVRQFRSLIP